MFCKYCGQQIDAQARFCSRCGRQLNTPAPVYTYAPVYAPVQPAVPVQPAAPAKKPVNGLGIAAFVLGIVSLFLGFYLLAAAIVGIVLGAIGVARRKKYRLNGLAIAGLVLSCVACAFWLIIWIFVFYYLIAGVFLLFFLPFLFI